VNKKKTDLTAEHAEIAEKQNTLAVPGDAGIFHAFLSALSELCGELLVSFSIRPAVFFCRWQTIKPKNHPGVGPYGPYGPEAAI
jgi:hypothetical protein